MKLQYKSLPKLPTTCCILGRVGTGKSSCMYSLLSKGYVNKKKSVFDEMVFFVGNQESDHALKSLPCKNIVVLHEFDNEAFDTYLEDLRKHQLERLSKHKAPLNVLIAFDDMATQDLLKKRNGKSPLASLVLTSRHELNATIFFLSQIYKNQGFTNPTIRNNVTTWIIYAMSKPEWEKIAEDHCNQFEPDELTIHYWDMMKTPHNFMVIDYRRPLNQRITERFTKVLKPLEESSDSDLSVYKVDGTKEIQSDAGSGSSTE